jgi:hypothetical protein
MPSSGLMQLSNGSSSSSNGVVVIGGNNSSRMDGTLSQSMDSVNTVAAEEEVSFFEYSFFLNSQQSKEISSGAAQLSVTVH